MIVELVSENLPVITASLGFGLVCKNIITDLITWSQLPKGPYGLPVVGYLPFLGGKPHLTLEKLRKKYGDVFTLRLGTQNVAILASWPAIKDAFSKDGFSGREEDSIFTAFKDDIDDAFMSNGIVWKEERRFALHQLRNLGFGRTQMEDHMNAEIEDLSARIDREMKTNGQANFKRLIFLSSVQNISALVFGRRLPDDDPYRIFVEGKIDDNPSLVGLFAFFPRLGKFFSYLGLFGFNSIREHARFSTKYIWTEIKKHKETFDPDNIRDYIDGYLLEMKSRELNGSQVQFTEERLNGNCQALFGAGIEAMSNSIQWAVITAAAYSDYQEKIYQEIISVTGGERPPTWADRTKMPFTNAFILELQRWKTLTPVNLLRMTVADTEVLGHKIPAKTLVLANNWAVHHDPKYWENPEEFKPNRFLSDDGAQIVKRDAHNPFSYGKRACPGEALANQATFLYLTRLIYKYKIQGINGETPPMDSAHALNDFPLKCTLVFERRQAVNEP